MNKIVEHMQQTAELETQMNRLRESLEEKERELVQTREVLQLLQETSKDITAEVNLDKIVQRITDKATEVSGAAFGAFFYKQGCPHQPSFSYAVSGVPRDMFSEFPFPALETIYQKTIRGKEVLRFDDVTLSPLYSSGLDPQCIPGNVLNIKSYLAAPVLSPANGGIVGAIFLGHPECGIFSEKEQRLLEGIALQGAIAMGNARLFEEKVLAESTYRNLVNSTFDAMVILDREARIVEVNDILCEMYQIPKEEFSHLQLRNLLLSYDPRFLNFSFLEKEGSFCFTSHGTTALGQALDLECRARLFHFGKVPHILLMLKDITQIVRTEAELRMSRNFSEIISETSPVALFLTNNNGGLSYVNSLWYEWTGESDENKHLGFAWMDFIHPEDASHFMESFRNAFNRKEALDADIRITNPKGSIRWVNIQAEPYNGQDHFFSGLAGSIMDITLRKVAEEKLRIREEKTKEELEKKVKERTAQLEKINHELLSFTSIASHDLKEPVRKISIFSKILREKLADTLTDEDGKRLESIIHASRRMTGLINDLLSFSRISHVEQAHFEALDLNAIIENILQDLELRIEETAAEVSVSPLPEVRGIAIQLNQVFQNLLSNSLKFRHSGRPLRISISGRSEPGGQVKITYQDNGIGFDNRFNEKIFEIFQRLHTKDAYEGTGIGLAIVKKIISLHNGTIEAFGDSGKGARFEIALPGKK